MTEGPQPHAIGTVDGTPVTWSTLLTALKCEGQWGSSVAALLRFLFVSQLAARHGIEVSESELQEEADRFRARRGLHKASDTHQWIARELIEEHEFARLVEHQLVVEKLKRAFPDDVVRARFEADRSRFDRARLAQIVTDSKGLAEELATRLIEEGEDFSSVARRHSLDRESAENGGFLGIVPRSDLSPEVADTVFRSRAGEIVGPFLIDGAFFLVKVLDLFPAALDTGIEGLVRSELLDEAIRLAVAGAEIELRFDQPG